MTFGEIGVACLALFIVLNALNLYFKMRMGQTPIVIATFVVVLIANGLFFGTEINYYGY